MSRFFCRLIRQTLHISFHFRQITADGQMLGTAFLALPTADTGRSSAGSLFHRRTHKIFFQTGIPAVGGHGVITVKAGGNIHALRAGNTIAAAGAGNFHTPPQNLFDFGVNGKIPFGKGPRFRFRGHRRVLLNLVQTVHTGKNHRHIRLVKKPSQPPIRRRTGRIRLFKNGGGL